MAKKDEGFFAGVAKERKKFNGQINKLHYNIHY